MDGELAQLNLFTRLPSSPYSETSPPIGATLLLGPHGFPKKIFASGKKCSPRHAPGNIRDLIKIFISNIVLIRFNLLTTTTLRFQQM